MNFIQQAYIGKNNWLRYIAVFFLVFIGWQFFGILPLAAVAKMYAPNKTAFNKAIENNFMGLGIDNNLFLFLMIVSFFIGLMFLFVGVKFIHKRNVTSLITSRKKIDWCRFWTGFISWGFIILVTTIIGVFATPENYVWNFKPIPFFTLVTISFLFLPFQTSFEELLFRGYLMQGFGIMAKNRWLPLVMTSVIFGLLHGANPEVEKLGYISMVFYIGTGFFYGITTLMDEGTELALGLHAINNIIAAFLVTANWSVFKTDALYIDVSEPSAGAEMFFPVLVLYPILLFYFSKKYHWSNWKEKLTGRIEKPIYFDE